MLRALQIIAIVLAGLVLLATVGLLVAEKTWNTPQQKSPEAYFLYGSTGTELMPLPVFQVLPDLFPENFQPAGKENGDWIDQYGFVRGTPEVNNGLPYGLSVTRLQPKSGWPSPVEFVGFNCAICHVTRMRETDNDPGKVVYGMGNASIDLVAFGDAVKTSLLNEKRLTPKIINDAYKQKFGKSIAFTNRMMITLWLTGVRKALAQDMALRGKPFGGKQLRDPLLFTSGPGRNQPMKETVRFLINETPYPDGGSSKIPCLYNQQHRHWAQFDGSLKDPITRNSLAALGVGASVINLRDPVLFDTLTNAATYVHALQGPSYKSVYPNQPIDAARVARGHDVYMKHCGDCHGWPGAKSGDWVRGKRLGEVVPATEVKTDDARVSFRFYPDMAQLIYDFFPKGHPLKPKRSELRPNPGDPLGYINAPIDSVFSRAPYLHNGSVATLAELINLKPRRPILWRGSNLHDPVDVGLVIPDQPDAKRYYRFDTSVYGNSNKGHDYPWAWDSPERNEEQLKDLLEYLKTL